GLRPELPDHGAVYRHTALAHQLFGGAARRNASLRQDLLQPFHFRRFRSHGSACVNPEPRTQNPMSLSLQQISPEACQLEDSADVGWPIGFGMRDEVA